MKTEIIFTSTLPHFYSGIWKERNNRIFREREAHAFVLADKIDSTMRENHAIRKGEILKKEEKVWKGKRTRR